MRRVVHTRWLGGPTTGPTMCSNPMTEVPPAMISGPDRRRRYGAIASRAWPRAGCRAPATATLRFQSTQRVAWLTAIDDSDEPGQGDVCTRHADALVLPRGWTLRDRRPTA